MLILTLCGTKGLFIQVTKISEKRQSLQLIWNVCVCNHAFLSTKAWKRPNILMEEVYGVQITVEEDF